MHIPELLAPVGSKEALIAAISNGADAVYFGGTSFSARQYASNFNREELKWAIDYAHARGTKAYVTVNTLIKESELEEACDYFQFLCSSGADAVIVQDLGILKILREQLPGLPVHASTQMTLHNIEGVKFLQEMGVKRVVLARELSLEEIKRIKSETGAQIEVFIHGALCFSYSGQCLLSSMIGGRSGNRGYCAQPCRKNYRTDGAEGYLLSPKDLNMSEHIPLLAEAGIDSFKIEGRMKRPEYVAGVVRVYRRLMDRYFEAPSKFRVTDEEKHTLRQLFNREFTTGYFFGDPGGELISRRYPHNIGTQVGKVVEYERRKKQVTISLKEPLVLGDGIGIGGKETGVIVRCMYVNDQSVRAAAPGSTVRIPMEHEAERGDVVFKTYDAHLMASLEIKDTRKIPIKMSFRAHVDEPVELWISDGENEVRIQGGRVSRAESMPLTRSAISEQLKKLGNTIFRAGEISFELDENIFIPVSELNNMRREAINQLERVRTQKWKRRCVELIIPAGQKLVESTSPILSVNTGSIESFKDAVNGGADVVYIGNEAYIDSEKNKEPQGFGIDERRFVDDEDYLHAIEYGRKKDVKVFISTPRIKKNINDLAELNIFSPQRTQRSQSQDTDMDLFPDGFLVANLGILYHLSSFNSVTPLVLDYPFNIFNRLTMEYLLNYSQRVTLSPELTLKEIGNLTRSGLTECIVQGNFPLMVSEHDLVRGLFPKGRGEVCLRDEKGFVFPVRTDKEGRTYIMNSRELCMLEYVPDLIRAGVNCLRIEAKTYDRETAGKLTRAYRDAIDIIGTKMKCSGEHTTGHYFRGVL